MIRKLMRPIVFFGSSANLAATYLCGPHGLYGLPDKGKPTDEHRPSDKHTPVLDRLAIIRGTIGVLILLVINVAYGTDLGDIGQLPAFPPLLADDETVVSAPFLMSVLAVALVCFTRRGHRLRAARQLVYPVQTTILVIAIAAAFSWITAQTANMEISSFAVWILLHLAELWCLLFLWCAAWWCAAGPFRAADGHPLLAPVAAMVFAWLAASRALNFGTMPTDMPHTLYFTVILGGPTTVTALSAFEVWRLHKWYPAAFPFREGPLKRQPQTQVARARVFLSAFVSRRFTRLRHQF